MQKTNFKAKAFGALQITSLLAVINMKVAKTIVSFLVFAVLDIYLYNHLYYHHFNSWVN